MVSDKFNHPYYPRDLKLPNYVPNENSILELLTIFFGIVASLILATWFYSGTRPHLKGRTITRFKICWFVACIVIHGILEAYFSVYYKTLVEEQTYLSQMWKEYGKADSRYVIGDSFTVCMETITGFVDGPLAALAAYAFLYNTPQRHIYQILLSLCQLYGDVLYFSTEIKDGFIHSKMYDPLYFWFYFVFLNALWIIIPSICIFESCVALNKAQCVADRVTEKKSSKKQ